MIRFTTSVSKSILSAVILLSISTNVTLVPFVWAEEALPPALPSTTDWWPMFGHDTHCSGFSTSTIPDNPVVLWQLQLAFTNYFIFPAILNGRLYVKDGYDLLCLQAATGVEIWRYQPADYFIVDGSPAVTDGLVYIGESGEYGDGYARMTCLDATTGLPIWSTVSGSSIWTESYSVKPLIYGDRVYYRSWGYENFGYYEDTYQDLYCLDRFDGGIIWREGFGHNWFYQQVVVGGKNIFISVENVDSAYRLLKIDAVSGDRTVVRNYFYDIPVFYNSRIYANDGGDVLCVDANTGETVWEHASRGSGYPAVGGGGVFTGVKYGRFICLDADTGDELWSTLYDDPHLDFSSPTVGDGKVLFAANDELMHCLDSVSGEEMWTLPIEISLSPRRYRPISIADSRIYVVDKDDRLICLGEPSPTVNTAIGCNPASGTLPFTATLSVTLENSYGGQARTMAAHIDVTLGNGSFYSNWRAGHLNLQPYSSRSILWFRSFPEYTSLIGPNEFQIIAEDVTPPPYNQPPYPPAGDTATASCTVTGVVP